MTFAARILLVVAMSLGLAHAAPPQTLHYQGFLTTNAGVPVNGATQIRFRLFDAAAAGNLLWEETHALVSVANGHYQVILGNTTAFGLDFNVPYWLGVKVGADAADMAPRQALSMVPYAFRAVTAQSAGDAQTLGGMAASAFAASAHAHAWQSIENVPAAFADGIDDDTTYSATPGGGLSLAGTSFSVVSCPPGQMLKATVGGWSCGVDADTTYAAGPGLQLSGPQFRVTPCPSGEFLRATGAGWECSSQLPFLQVTATSTPPASCDASGVGRIYFDSDGDDLCVCRANAGSYAYVGVVSQSTASCQ